MNLNVFSDSSYNRDLAKHGKSYATKAEYLMRKELHDKALEDVIEHNQKEGQTWIKAVNKFSDMTDTELKRFFGSLDASLQTEKLELPEYPTNDLLQQGSQYVDWRSIMSPVKNQG